MRSELPQLIALARRLLDSGERGTLATLFAADGSSYRSLGSMMVGGPPGFVAGGVSGGCLEEYIVRHGRELTREHAAVLLCFDTGSADDVEDAKPVLGCGGSIQVLVERLTRDHLDHLLHLAEAYDADVPSLTTCTVEAAQDHPAGVIVSRTWGRRGTDGATASLARDALCDRRSYSGPVGATRQALVHYVPALTRLVIFGAGDDVRPVCDLGRSLGWHVTVADRRARHARPERFPSANVVIAAPWEAAVDQIRFTENTAVVLMTHSLPDDVILLPLLAEKPFAYAGVLGPAHRRDVLIQLASEEAPLHGDFLSRLRGPVGLDLGDRSVGGIAVSVIAEIVAHLNDRAARPMSTPSRVPGRPALSRGDA
jgi:xanthine dehydrogenase accessory factor